MLRSPAVPYVVPFVTFLGYLALRQWVRLPDRAEQILCLVVMTVVLLVFSRTVLQFKLKNPLGSVLLGVAVFAVWIAPESLFPGYRQHWLFSNSLLGSPQAGLTGAAQSDSLVLLLRALRASIIVPIIEELFWRAWLMRWIISPEFEEVPLGKWSASAFWTVAVLFASEHGSYWEVGLLAGVAYNWWMVRTKSLGDLILTHGITNACLSAYVVATGSWQYW